MRTSELTVRRAKSLRRRMPLPEVLLWIQLRREALGVRFRRQHPVGPYILDFYCPDASLAVEVDGYSHGVGDRPAHDARRDAWLEANGVEVLRISAETVLSDMTGALMMVETAVKARVG